uniref:Uncharacterized protein n=1 Tax=Panagrolaimus sp. ES5 TaxID=591445 RepID=A0AC34GHT2_9BILA
MVVKRVKAGKPKRVVKKTVVKKSQKVDTDDSKKRVSFAKKLTHSKIIEEDVNVSQNFDVTPSKGILKTKKRIAEQPDQEAPPPVKTIKKPTFDKENRIPVERSDEPTRKQPIQKFQKTIGKKKLVVKKSIKE